MDGRQARDLAAGRGAELSLLHEVEDGNWIRVQQLYGQLADLGYPKPDDRLHRCHKAGLIGIPRRRIGYGTDYWYSRDDACRIQTIYETTKRFGLKDADSAELAFWLVARGQHLALNDLVVKHLDATLGVLTNRAVRWTTARAAGAIAASEFTVLKTNQLARLIVRSLQQTDRDQKSSLMQQCLESASALALRAILRRDPYPAVGSTLKRLLSVLMGAEIGTANAETCWNIVREFVACFNSDGNMSPLCRSVFENRDDPDTIALACQDAILQCNSLDEAFPQVFFADSDGGSLISLSPEDRRLVNRYFAPLVTIILLHVKGDQYSRALRERLRRAERVDDFALLRRSWELIRARITAAQTEQQSHGPGRRRIRLLTLSGTRSPGRC